MNTANLSPLSQNKTIKKIKLLVFSINNINFALHIDSVQKVINYSTIHSSGLNHYGIVTIENKEITVINLYKKLFNESQSLDGQEKKYLLLVYNSFGETFGIIITQAPSLYDIDMKDIRVLPPSYRRADTLKIASHVTIIHQEEAEDKTIFILDPDELVAPA